MTSVSSEKNLYNLFLNIYMSQNYNKGYFYVIIAQFFVLGFFIFSKLSLNYFNFLTVSSLWFGFSALFSTGMVIFKKKLPLYKEFKKKWRWIVLTYFINSIAVVTSVYSLSIISSTLNSFLGKISLLMMVLMGIIFLNEKFNFWELLSGVIIIGGIIMISFSKGEYLLTGIIMIIISKLAMSLSRFIVKKKLIQIDPLILVNYRAILVFLFIFIFALSFGEFKVYPTIGLFYATIPSIFSVIFYYLYIYKAYKFLDFSKVALMEALNPLLVLFAAFFILGETLTLLQFFGGITIVFGVLGLIYFHRKISIPLES